MTDSSAITHPIYVFVGGICHPPEMFTGLIGEMQKCGVTSTAVKLLTVGENTEGKTQQDEITAIRDSVLEQLDGQDRDVILVCHSYGGWSGSRAVKGLDKQTRLAQGAKTGIVELIFIAAFLVPDNASTERYSATPPWLSKKGNVGMMNELVKPVLMHDLSPEEQEHWFAQFQPHRIELPKDTCPDAPWHLQLPKTYIIPTAELPPSIDLQFTWLNGVLDKTWSIKTIKTAHEPFLSKPADLAKVILAPTYRKMVGET